MFSHSRRLPNRVITKHLAPSRLPGLAVNDVNALCGSRFTTTTTQFQQM